MARLGVHGSDALFEGEEGFVDFRSFEASLTGVGLGVLGSLGACEIAEDELSFEFSVLGDVDLADGVGAGGGVVGDCGVGCTRVVAEVDDLVHLCRRFCLLFGDSLDLDLDDNKPQI